MKSRLAHVHLLTAEQRTVARSLATANQFLPMYAYTRSERWHSLYPKRFETMRLNQLVVASRELSRMLQTPVLCIIYEARRYFLYSLSDKGSIVSEFADQPANLPPEAMECSSFNPNIETLPPYLATHASLEDARKILLDHRPLSDAALVKRKRSYADLEKALDASWVISWKEWRAQHPDQDPSEIAEAQRAHLDSRERQKSKPLVGPEDFLVAFAGLIGLDWRQASCSYSLIRKGEAEIAFPELKFEHLE